jgi:hypothetical protein
MTRLIHRELMRGHLVQGAAILLMVGLLVCLAVSLIAGVRTLQA